MCTSKRLSARARMCVCMLLTRALVPGCKHLLVHALSRNSKHVHTLRTRLMHLCAHTHAHTLEELACRRSLSFSPSLLRPSTHTHHNSSPGQAPHQRPPRLPFEPHRAPVQVDVATGSILASSSPACLMPAQMYVQPSWEEYVGGGDFSMHCYFCNRWHV